MGKDLSDIKLSVGNNLKLNLEDKKIDKLLIAGNTINFFGFLNNGNLDYMSMGDEDRKRYLWLLKRAIERTEIFVIGEIEEKEHYIDLFNHFGQQGVRVNWKYIETFEPKDYLKIIDKIKNMKFDVCIINPPYDKDLHLQFFDKMLNAIDNKAGQLVIIEPATWLINVRTAGKAKKYNQLKDKIEGHVKSVEINGMNKAFDTGLYVPFSIVTIDNSHTGKIEFECSTEKTEVESIYDCNKIGSYKLIQSIIDKCQKRGDVMKDHSTTKELDMKDVYYLRYMSIITAHGYHSKVDQVDTKFGKYYGTFTTPACHKSDQKLYEHLPKTAVGNPAPCVYGTKEELENWKYYVYNNKLPIFINCVMTIDQHNNSEKYIPWLVDKKYEDTEIYAILGIDEDEQKLIDDTLEKFEWHNKWYKKMMEE